MRGKLTDRNKKKMLHVWDNVPCITKAMLAYIFDISPSRVGEVIREYEEAKRRRIHAENMINDICEE